MIFETRPPRAADRLTDGLSRRPGASTTATAHGFPERLHLRIPGRRPGAWLQLDVTCTIRTWWSGSAVSPAHAGRDDRQTLIWRSSTARGSCVNPSGLAPVGPALSCRSR